MGALHVLSGFLAALTHADGDGRIIHHPGAGTAKFVLLNAAAHFHQAPAPAPRPPLLAGPDARAPLIIQLSKLRHNDTMRNCNLIDVRFPPQVYQWQLVSATVSAKSPPALEPAAAAIEVSGRNRCVNPRSLATRVRAGCGGGARGGAGQRHPGARGGAHRAAVPRRRPRRHHPLLLRPRGGAPPPDGPRPGCASPPPLSCSRSRGR